MPEYTNVEYNEFTSKVNDAIDREKAKIEEEGLQRIEEAKDEATQKVLQHYYDEVADELDAIDEMRVESKEGAAYYVNHPEIKRRHDEFLGQLSQLRKMGYKEEEFLASEKSEEEFEPENTSSNTQSLFPSIHSITQDIVNTIKGTFAKIRNVLHADNERAKTEGVEALEHAETKAGIVAHVGETKTLQKMRAKEERIANKIDVLSIKRDDELLRAIKKAIKDIGTEQKNAGEKAATIQEQIDRKKKQGSGLLKLIGINQKPEEINTVAKLQAEKNQHTAEFERAKKDLEELRGARRQLEMGEKNVPYKHLPLSEAAMQKLNRMTEKLKELGKEQKGLNNRIGTLLENHKGREASIREAVKDLSEEEKTQMLEDMDKDPEVKTRDRGRANDLVNDMVEVETKKSVVQQKPSHDNVNRADALVSDIEETTAVETGDVFDSHDIDEEPTQPVDDSYEPMDECGTRYEYKGNAPGENAQQEPQIRTLECVYNPETKEVSFAVDGKPISREDLVNTLAELPDEQFDRLQKQVDDKRADVFVRMCLEESKTAGGAEVSVENGETKYVFQESPEGAITITKDGKAIDAASVTQELSALGAKQIAGLTVNKAEEQTYEQTQGENPEEKKPEEPEQEEPLEKIRETTEDPTMPEPAVDTPEQPGDTADVIEESVQESAEVTGQSTEDAPVPDADESRTDSATKDPGDGPSEFFQNTQPDFFQQVARNKGQTDFTQIVNTARETGSTNGSKEDQSEHTHDEGMEL